ncbi:MAG TPA: DUF1800 domain-containing protein [Gemmatimonadaceae bacterium]
MRRYIQLGMAGAIGVLPIVISAQRAARPAAPATAMVATVPTVREQTADQQVLQVLNRLAFGPRPGEVQQVRGMGVDAWIELQLHPQKIDDSAMDQMLARYSLLDQDQTALEVQYTQAQRERRLVKRDASDTSKGADVSPEFKQIQRERAQLAGQLMSARVARAVASNRQLQEVMTDFWENHFSVYIRKNAVEAYYLEDYDRTIREHSLGKFRDLLGAVAHSPAMLVFLDNAQSRANPGEPTLPAVNARGMVLARGAGGGLRAAMQINVRQRAAAANAKQRAAGLNENYGRELLELHTLGVDGGYTQQDVIEAARALTGWTIKPPAQGGGFVFRPEWHDAGPKTFMGHQLEAGRGEQDGDDILDIVSRSPATAHFIALKLCRRFVTDSPSTALVDRAAETFRRTDGNIAQVMRTIVESPEFFSARAYHSKVKAPFEVVVSAARALGAQPDTTPRTALAVAYLGEPIFGHQAPNGWPETGDEWMNTGAILNRINFGMAVGANRLPGASVHGLFGADSLENASRGSQVDAVVSAILGGAVSPDMRKILMSGEHPLAANAAQHATSETAQAQAVAAVNAEPDSASGDMSMTQAPGTPARLARGKQGNRGALGGLGGNALGRNGVIGPAPELTGLAQVVGLALGSPEFQRR